MPLMKISEYADGDERGFVVACYDEGVSAVATGRTICRAVERLVTRHARFRMAVVLHSNKRPEIPPGVSNFDPPRQAKPAH